MDVRIEACKIILKKRPIVKEVDAGHGWYRVPLMVLVALGIEKKISACSYLSANGRDAWLEEDCDAGVLFDALEKSGIDYGGRIGIACRYVDNSTIRDLPSYKEVK